MQQSAEPLTISDLRARTKKDFASGLWPYRLCLIWVGLKTIQATAGLLFILIGSLIMNSAPDATHQSQLQQWYAANGIAGCLRLLLQASVVVLSIIAALRLVYLVNHWLMRWLIAWQQRHAWSILTGSSVLVAMLLSGDLKGPQPEWPVTGAPDQATAHTGYTFRSSRPGKARSYLEALLENFDTACSRLGLRGVPRGQLWLQWLAVVVPILLAVVAYIIFMYVLVNVIGPSNPNALSTGSTEYRYFMLMSSINVSVTLLAVAFAMETIPAARRIGIRRALLDYFTTDGPLTGGSVQDQHRS